jgi:copper oxidase (laccase) domain-containing protein
LRQAGLRDECIDDVPGCTKHRPEFHSFRRDGANSGRMLASIATPPANRPLAR